MVYETRVKTGDAAHGLRVLRRGLRPMSIATMLAGLVFAIVLIGAGFAFAVVTP